MSASPDEPSLTGPKPSSPQTAAKWSAGITIAFLLLVWFMPSLMSWKITILLGALLIVFAGWLARKEHAWLKSAQVVPGTVVELIPVAGAKGRPSYRPRVRYTTPDGTVHDFIRAYSSNPVGVDIGESLAVAYHEASPQDLRILTFGQRFGFAAFVAVLGVCLMLLGATFLAGRHYVPRVYLQWQPPASPGPGR